MPRRRLPMATMNEPQRQRRGRPSLCDANARIARRGRSSARRLLSVISPPLLEPMTPGMRAGRELRQKTTPLADRGPKPIMHLRIHIRHMLPDFAAASRALSGRAFSASSRLASPTPAVRLPRYFGAARWRFRPSRGYSRRTLATFVAGAQGGQDVCCRTLTGGKPAPGAPLARAPAGT